MKIIISIILISFFSNHSFSEFYSPSIEKICNRVENEIKDLELMKSNL